MIYDFESVSTNALCLYYQKRYGYNKKDAHKEAIRHRRRIAQQKRAFRAKKYTDFIKIRRSLNNNYFECFSGQAYFTIKECKLILRRSREIINTRK